MIQKKKPNKSFILRLCILAFVVYTAVVLVDMQITLTERRSDLEVLAANYEAQRLENKELERQLAVGVDNEYIERVARDKLDYVYPEERVFIDISGN